MKITLIGCGLRTPLLVHGLARAGLSISSMVLYDIKPERAQLMACLGSAIAAGTPLKVTAADSITAAVQGCSFVISSIRVGEMDARARDERLALECGFAGQETTGPAGFAMALRTAPVAVEYARLVERLAPQAWIINFTNPAGLITQAISAHSGARVVGICDTPAELFFRIALALREPPEQVECDYLGLNHLGWVRAVRVRGEDVTNRLLDDDGLLRSLYPAPLFSTALHTLLTPAFLPSIFFSITASEPPGRINCARAPLAPKNCCISTGASYWISKPTSVTTTPPAPSASIGPISIAGMPAICTWKDPGNPRLQNLMSIGTPSRERRDIIALRSKRSLH